MLEARSLFTRFALLVAAALLVLHGVWFYHAGHDQLVGSARTAAMGLAARTWELDQQLLAAPELLPLLQTPGYRLERVTRAELPGPSRWPHDDEVIAAVREHLATLGLAETEGVRVAYLPGRGVPRMQVLLPSAAGGFLLATGNIRLAERARGVFMSLTIFTVLVLVLWFARRQSRQLRRFVSAAEALAEGQRAPPLPEQVGPSELRRASRAFNHMQVRVLRLLDERSAMLAGMSHDLRTLATRLGLRVESLADAHERDKASADIALMTDILDQALAFNHDDASEEDRQVLHLGSVAQTLVAEFQDRGTAVTLAEHAQPSIEAQPAAVHRLLMNLIDNAVKYGGEASVDLYADRVTVTDAGEGFSEADVAAALTPYRRLEEARSQMRPGTGLGLSIVKNVCNRHGWRLRFERLAPGFRVTVAFAAHANVNLP